MDLKFLISHMLTFILILYANPALSRKIVIDVVNIIENFVKNFFLPSVQNDILIVLRENKVDDVVIKKIDNVFNKHSSIFHHVNTESKCFSLLRKKGFIDFNLFKIGEKFV